MLTLLTALGALAVSNAALAQSGFEISVSPAARGEPITGRVYVAITRSRDARQTPIEQTGETGVPLFGVDIQALSPGRSALIDERAFGHPVQSLRDLPRGEYWVQPFVNVYTRFARADGHTVWMHMDHWEGQSWRRSPGNIYGDPVRIMWDPGSRTPIRLVADKVIAPVQVPPDNEYVRRIKMQSTILTKWWGHPIFLGATILLPKDYDRHPNVRYPVVYSHGHFSLRAPGNFGDTTGRGGAGFTSYWQSDGTPRMILVTLQHPSPYYDDSYGVNSANNGPYGDAIIQELIPAVESKFRVIREPWARLLTGGSTGGWISLAHQVLYPDFYGGTWSLCPDAPDFRYHQIVNVYADTNAYWFDRGWMRVERPTRRRPDGNVEAMMKDENWFELAVGDHSRSGGQWDIWEATYGPVSADGYPKRIWDKRTGVIDKSVAAYWKERYDLRHILERDWQALGPKVADKINVYVGDADSYFLNMGVRMLENFLKQTTNPKWTGEIVYQPMAPHCWGPSLPELLPKMAAQVERRAPSGAPRTWRY
jgi:enterochelin esterase-like enzyme